MRARPPATAAHRPAGLRWCGCVPVRPRERRAVRRCAPPPPAPARERAPRRACRCARCGRRSWLTFAEKAVADSPHGEEVTRRGRIPLEALAQAQDEVIHRAGRGKYVVSPDTLEQILARDDLTRVLGQHLEDHRFLLGELLRLAVPGAGAERPEVDLVATEAQHC